MNPFVIFVDFFQKIAVFIAVPSSTHLAAVRRALEKKPRAALRLLVSACENIAEALVLSVCLVSTAGVVYQRGIVCLLSSTTCTTEENVCMSACDDGFDVSHELKRTAGDRHLAVGTVYGTTEYRAKSAAKPGEYPR